MKNTFKKPFAALLAAAMILCAVIGAFSTSAASSKLAGDVNKDGEVDNKDVVVLFRFMSGAVSENDVDIIACDTNGDGERDNKDVAILFRYLNGAGVEIFYGKEEPEPESEYLYKLWDDKTIAAFESPKQTVASLTDEGVMLKFTSGSPTDPYIKFNIAKYAQLTEGGVPTGADGSFIVLKYKSNADGYLEIFTHAPAGGDSFTTTYTPDEEFHYVIADMTKTSFVTKDKLSTVRFDWSGGETAAGNYMIISEIGFFADLSSALRYTKLKETDVYKESAGILKFSSDKGISKFVTTTSADTAILKKTEENAVSALITSQKKSPKIIIDLNALADLDGKTVKKADYIAVRVRVKGQSGLKISLQSVTDVSGYNVTITGQSSTIDCSEEGWQGAMFNIRDAALFDNRVKKINIALSGFVSTGTVEIGAVVVSSNINDALTVCEHTEYCLNYDSTLTDNDELADKVLFAENEDETLKLWFDQTTEKTNRNETYSTGRTGFTVRMAKNEVENCQFFIAPSKDLKARIVIDEFSDGKGNTVPFEVFYEYYHNINNVMIPDAIPPLTDAINVAAGNSQGFVIQLSTTPDTPAGTYNSVIHVYDESTGKEIKRAAVAVKVWDFALSEETELRTAFALWTGYIFEHYNWDAVDFDYYDVVDNYFNFFRKYRINIMDHPNGITSSKGKAYMSDPRTNTARWLNLDVSVTEDNDGVTPDWIDKVIYYPGEIDEPRTNQHFALMAQIYDRIKANTESFKMVAPFERNLDLNADGTIATSFESSAMDQIEYMSRYLGIWCPTLNAFTTRDLGFISRVSYIQSEEQDAKYGTFMERMKKEVAEGDELWTYICINPREPYANWQLLSDGTEAIVSAKEYGITGMLYWAVNHWKVNYMNQNTPWTGDAYGDGILIYSGYFFGPLPSPVSSLRLENIRDGIEDYQMLCMLEDALGEEAANDMISRITTSVVTYANNDDYIHAVRVLLGDTLEEALNK